MAYQVVILQQNRVCKIAVANLGANKTPTGLKRVGKCVGVLAELQATYNKELKVTELSGNHTVVSATKDKNIMLQQLLEANVFGHIDDREHTCFQDIKKNIMSSIKEKSLHRWMKEKVHLIRNKIYC